MGGKALGFEAKRLDLVEYNKITAKVLSALDDDCCLDNYGGTLGRMTLIRSYTDKESFGDADFLYTEIYDGKEELKNRLINKLEVKPEHIVVNEDITGEHSVISFGLPLEDGEVFQVDLIKTSEQYRNFAYNYFNYNDAGNLIGNNARKLGFRLGHRGLRYKFGEGPKFYGDLLVTDNFREALEFLGYDFIKYCKGFNDLEQIFNYAVSCPYVSKESYRLANLTSKQRVRDRKRTTYTKFLEWLETQENIPETIFVDQEAHLKRALERFPKFEEQYRQAVRFEAARLMYRSKFNGKLVQDFFDLKGVPLAQGPELGKVMEAFKASYGNDALFEKYVLFNDAGKILNDFFAFYVKNKK